MVPSVSIAFMSITAAACIAVPTALYCYWRKKHELTLGPMLLGIVVFFTFTLLIQESLHVLVLQPNEEGYIRLLDENPWGFVLYAVISGSIIRETGRYAAFRILKKSHEEPGTALSLGIGNGGIDAFMLIGLPMLSYMSISASINEGGIAAIGDYAYMLSLANALAAAHPATYLAETITALITVAASISLSVIVFASVIMKGRLWLLPAAILLQAMLSLAPIMYQAGFFDNVWLVASLMLMPAALIIIAAQKVWKAIG